MIHDEIVGGAITAHDGQVVKHLGDGMMATFPSSVRAVEAAVTMQQELDLRNRRGDGEQM